MAKSLTPRMSSKSPSNARNERVKSGAHFFKKVLVIIRLGKKKFFFSQSEQKESTCRELSVDRAELIATGV